MLPIHQQRIQEALHNIGKIRPEVLAPVIASYYAVYSFSVARQELQHLADTLSSMSVSISGFILDADWQRRDAQATEQQRKANQSSHNSQGEALLSVLRVAELLGVQKQKVYNMINSGKLPHININQDIGKKPLIRIRASDVPH